MKPNDIQNQLHSIASSANFAELSLELTQKWSNAAESFDAVEPVLQFMEKHPSINYGMPGPLVHFVEDFMGKGYEQKLVDSINRKPTSHTLWMLNRIINSTKSAEEGNHFIEILRKASTNPMADIDAQRIAIHFLNRVSP
jgi:hypothetical protein